MDCAPRSCPNHHGPNGCTCLPLQEHQHQQCQLHHPPATLPLHSLDPATTVFTGSRIHFPASQTVTNSYNTSNDYHDRSQFHNFHGANYGNTVYSPQPYDQSSNSQLHLPSESQHLPFHFASPCKVLLSLFRNRTMKWPTHFSFPSLLTFFQSSSTSVGSSL
jgi:hypothetical protein